ncbi:MAG: Hint domain-containing protein, partial [Candidatus Portnoybacteria bacterium]|nr:Hint domain-containing protein [Candidatus Portnoybacteria bacterium]
VGIGTTTPDSKLVVAGQIHASTTVNQLKLSYDDSTSKYATFSVDSNGDLTLNLAANNSTTTISDNLSVLGYLNVEGNATTTGSQYIKKDLTVDGQCVTGDTLLPIVNLGTVPAAGTVPKFTRIDEVQPGDYVLSLNEKTGELTPAKIKQLMDMGVKTIYEIETEDGRTIRTTGNHPYLANKKSAQSANSLGSSNLTQDSSLSTCYQYSNSENLVKCFAGDINKTVEVGGIEPPDSWLTNRNPRQATPTADLLYHNQIQEAKWTKVVYLSEGDEIAVADLSFGGSTSEFGSVKFVKIARISILPPEQVYDIEVEGTHNFVANGIIAHNTVFNGVITQTGNL